MGSSVGLVGNGVKSSTTYEHILRIEQLGQLRASPTREPRQLLVFGGKSITYPAVKIGRRLDGPTL